MNKILKAPVVCYVAFAFVLAMPTPSPGSIQWDDTSTTVGASGSFYGAYDQGDGDWYFREQGFDFSGSNDAYLINDAVVWLKATATGQKTIDDGSAFVKAVMEVDGSVDATWEIMTSGDAEFKLSGDYIFAGYYETSYYAEYAGGWIANPVITSTTTSSFTATENRQLTGVVNWGWQGYTDFYDGKIVTTLTREADGSTQTYTEYITDSFDRTDVNLFNGWYVEADTSYSLVVSFELEYDQNEETTNTDYMIALSKRSDYEAVLEYKPSLVFDFTSVTAVPEPATWVVGVGCFVLAASAVARRRKR